MTAALLTSANGASSTVRIKLDHRGIVINCGAMESIVWPYGALHASPPLSSNQHSATITYDYAPGQTLQVDDHMLLQELAGAAPKLTQSSQTYQSRVVPAMWLGFVAALIAGVWWLMNLDVSGPIARSIPDETRNAIGQALKSSMVAQHGTCQLAEGSAAIEALSERLLEASPSRERIKSITVLDWDLVNAFAGPGGHLFLTRGLIKAASGPDEVAGVLAHEMGHAIAIHPERGLIREIGLMAGLSLLFGGGIATDLGRSLLSTSYSRAQEREADRLGVQLLHAADISHLGLAQFFDRLAGKEGQTGTVLTVFSTHPASSERLASLKSLPKIDASPALSARQWGAMRSICVETSKKSRNRKKRS